MDRVHALIKLGETIRNLREKREVTQLAFAEATGIDIYTQNLLEDGKYDPSMAELLIITDFYQLSMAELFKDFDTV